MKKAGIKISLMLLLLLFIQQVTAQTTHGLEYYLPFNEGTGNPVDQGPIGYGAVYSNSGSWTQGTLDSAVNFSSNNDVIQINETMGFRTVTFWFKPNQMINGTISYNMRLLHQRYKSEDDGFYIHFEKSGDPFPGQIVARHTTEVGDIDIVNSTTNSWETSVWYFVAITFDPVIGAKLFINDVVKDTNTNETGGWSIGFFSSYRLHLANDYLDGSPFNGVIDELRFYDRALAEFEVQELYQYGLTGAGSAQASGVLWSNGTNGDIYYNDGNVVIGDNAVPTGYKLAVNGNAVMEEITVDLADNWPDYVFEKSYTLPDLKELELFINTNKHLPEIPSALEIQDQGIPLGKMQTKLLQKIEELTLYVIQLNKENQYLSEQNKKLQWRLEKVETKFSDK